ncbi:hypothetical protein MKX08_007397 [Trichoderma sp. CBMAI-0020]|nr:hypothetical protein MKX08_007397 [Trichoderma sp. CBMAI-0020]
MPPLRPLKINLRNPISTHRLSSTFTSRPAPPKLPAAQQAEFERLQRAAAVSSAFQDIQAQTQTPPSTESPRHATNVAAASNKNSSDGESSLNQGLFRGAPPEFEGDTNPKTGEVGGPKNEPLRWGGDGDWSYNGRVTDF